LECIPQVDDKGMVDLYEKPVWSEKWSEIDRTNLFQQPSLLYNIWNSFHLHAFSLVDVFEGIELASLLVLDDPNLKESNEVNRIHEKDQPCQKHLSPHIVGARSGKD
jgi:hypothetical protein